MQHQTTRGKIVYLRDGEETGREDVGVGLDASRVWAMAMASGNI